MTATMNQTTDEFDRAKRKMLGDFNKAISDAAEQREAAADAAGEGIAAARAEFEEKSEGAVAKLPDATSAAARVAGEALAAADVHVQDIT